MKRSSLKTLTLILLLFTISMLTSEAQVNDTVRAMFLEMKCDLDSISNVLLQNEKEIFLLKIENAKMDEQLAEQKVAKEFFASSLSTQTGLFSVIVALSIFIASFLIPRKRENKYKKLIIETKKQIDVNQKEISGILAFLDMARLYSLRYYQDAFAAGVISIRYNLSLTKSIQAERIGLTLDHLNVFIDKLNKVEIEGELKRLKTTSDELISKLEDHPFSSIYTKPLNAFKEKIKRIS